MKAKDVRGTTEKDLQEKLSDLEKNVIDAYFDMRMGKVKNVRKPRQLRKDVAVLKTVLAEKSSEKKGKAKLSTRTADE